MKVASLYVVGKLTPGQAHSWELQGVFDDVEKAFRACRTAHYFIGPVELNVEFPDRTTEWTGCWYPHLESNPAPCD